MTAVNKAGKAKAKSLKRITVSSTHPRFPAAKAPSGTPIPAPNPIAITETNIEFHAPTINMENTSRPK